MRTLELFIVCAVLMHAFVNAEEFIDENGNKIESNVESIDSESERAKKSTNKLQVINW